MYHSIYRRAGPRGGLHSVIRARSRQAHKNRYGVAVSPDRLGGLGPGLGLAFGVVEEAVR